MSPTPSFPPPHDKVAAGTAAVTFVNHATFLLRLPAASPAGIVVLTDPIFSERCSPLSWAGPRRARRPGLAFDALPRPDLVLLSHNHYDHMDLPSLRALWRRHAPRFITMLGNAAHLTRAGIEATELDWWDAVEVAGLLITATPARHFSARTPFDRNRALWGGFMLDTPGAPGVSGGKVLFAGDSGAGPHWAEIAARLGSPDVALLPIGAYEPRWFMAPVHMNPGEAVQAHHDLRALCRNAFRHLPTHRRGDRRAVAGVGCARAAAGLATDRFDTHGFGETRLYRLGGAA
jgi:L-ascorbate metabolism protein UlaG (beta-lactamase superfamily)